MDKALKTLWLQGFNRVKTKQELMISALEAYEKTSYVLDNALRNELKTVENKINEAIEKGEFHITLYDTFLSSSTKSTLEKLGYKVERISDNTTLIVWEFASK